MKKLLNVLVVTVGVGFGFGMGQGVVSSHRPAVAWAQESGNQELRADTSLASAVGEDQAVIHAVKQALPTVVSISHGEDSGSGILIRENGVILTNAHVVDGTQNVKVSLSDGRSLPGRVIGADQGRDLAVVKVSGNDFPTAQLGDSDHIEIGQTAIAIGNPLGLDRTVTRGVISGIDRTPEDLDLGHLIQTDASINPGNSGGPLLDIRGRVVGINSAAMHGRRISGISFAIPINSARDYARSVLEGKG